MTGAADILARHLSGDGVSGRGGSRLAPGCPSRRRRTRCGVRTTKASLTLAIGATATRGRSATPRAAIYSSAKRSPTRTSSGRSRNLACHRRCAPMTGSRLRLGIRLERSAPGHPEQNGRHERLHLTLKTDATRPAASNVLQQQARFDQFVHRYNHERPHQAPPAAGSAISGGRSTSVRCLPGRPSGSGRSTTISGSSPYALRFGVRRR